MRPKNSVSIIEAECAQALAGFGIDMAAGVGTIPVNDDFFGWLGLNAGRHAGFIRINPFVGIHCPAIMEMTAAAGGKRHSSAKTVATYAVFLGALCPQIEQFIFPDEMDASGEAQRLSSIVGKFGIPYMRQIADYATLLPLLEARISTLGGYPQRYAAALYLSGDRQRAVKFIDEEMVSLKEANAVEVIEALENLRKSMLTDSGKR
jgi:hypothetical protein